MTQRQKGCEPNPRRGQDLGSGPWEWGSASVWLGLSLAFEEIINDLVFATVPHRADTTDKGARPLKIVYFDLI